MNNYMNDYTIMKESSVCGSRYLMLDEKQQRQWIDQVAKQAAKLISKQITDKQTKDSNNLQFK